MTASRLCRACGAELRGHMMWCLRCYEPVRHLTPRATTGPAVAFLPGPERGVVRSRWKAGVNTFGPVGRIAITLLVVALAPWSTNVVALVVMWPAYLVLAALVLRATWKKDHVLDTPIAAIGAKGRPAGEPTVPGGGPVPRSIHACDDAGSTTNDQSESFSAIAPKRRERFW